VKRLHETQAATEQQLIAAESAFHTARSRLEQTQIALTFTELRAPFDGRVTDRHAETGMLANPGQTLLNLYDPSRMRLDVPVPVRLIDYLAIGDAVELQLERPAARLNGTVYRVVSEIDTRTRTQTVQILLDSMAEVPMPGTFGRLWIPTTEQEMALVPETAVYRIGQLELVQVVEDDRVLRRLVKTGTERQGEIEILSGLTDGERILRQPIK
jgi:RND family efflux transporter MFP subunit